MSADLKLFPGIVDPSSSLAEQPDQNIVVFCEDLLARAKCGEIRGIAVAVVKPGKLVIDGWQSSSNGRDCCHELMAAICYLHARYVAAVNERSTSETPS